MTRFQKLAASTLGTAILLVTVGVIVRATDSGLGCPDWPLCHGQLLPPLGDAKAWIEWVHRTLAAIIGFEILGLAALAWIDQGAPDLVYVARGALCPLAVATDVRGNLYWASSPTWFRRLDERSGGRLGFEVERVPEGMLLAIAASGSPAIRARCSFEPVARPGDDWRFPSIWNGVDRVDVEAFQAEASHRTARSSPVGRGAELVQAAPVG